MATPESAHFEFASIRRVPYPASALGPPRYDYELRLATRRGKVSGDETSPETHGPAMLIQLFLATAMVLVTVLVHLVGLAILLRILQIHHRWVQSRIRPITLLLTATIGVFVIHTVEIWLYAALFLALGAASLFEEALYFSTVTYATIGYGDVLLAKDWRVLGAIEGATGVIMLGWSTAFLVSLLTQMKLMQHDWLQSGSS